KSGPARLAPRLATVQHGAAREAARRALEIRAFEPRQAEIKVRFGEIRAQRERALEERDGLLEAPQIVHHRSEHAKRVRIVWRELERFLEMVDGVLMLGQASVQHAKLKMDRRGGRPVIERLAVSRNGRVRLAFLLQILGKRKGASRVPVPFRAAGKKRFEQSFQDDPPRAAASGTSTSHCVIFTCKW